MYVVRYECHYKWGKDAVIVEGLKKIAAATGTKGRVYTNRFGNSQVIVSEIEYPDAASAAEARDASKRTEFTLREGANPDDADLDKLGWNDVVIKLNVEMWHVETY